MSVFGYDPDTGVEREPNPECEVADEMLTSSREEAAAARYRMLDAMWLARIEAGE